MIRQLRPSNSKYIAVAVLLLSLLLTTSFASSTALAQAQENEPTFRCEQGSVQILILGKIKKYPKKICTNSNFTTFASENCLKNKCALFKKFLKKDFTGYNLISEYSNPGFKLCAELGLTANIVTYVLKDGTEIKSDMCEDKSDSSFINTSFLVEKLIEKER